LGGLRGFQGSAGVAGSQYNGAMDIHQLSVDYSEEQDRIMLRINTSQGDELRFWFTRRLLHKLWPNLKRVVADQVVRFGEVVDPARLALASMDESDRSMLADFHRSESLKGADFSTPFNNHPQRLPLGEQPLLVTEVKLASLDNGQLQIKLSEQFTGAGTQRSCQMDVPTHLTQGMVHLLEQTLARCGWNDTLALTAGQSSTTAIEGVRPKYLN
jgi:hypothetical protein